MTRISTPSHFVLALVVFAGTSVLSGQEAGRQTFEQICAACHGTDGKGTVGSELYAIEMPDFTQCSFVSREPNDDFFAVAAAGGPIRGFNPLMPAHRGTLSDEQIQAALNYVRTFCTETGWPRGELNLPRPLFTEKAYPEDEAVITTTANVEGGGAIISELLYEKRFGKRSQIELKLPFGFREGALGSDWSAGIGDPTIGLKHTVFHSLASGSILSLGSEVKLPLGDEDDGFGTGTTIYEPFVSFGQILGSAFLHVQTLAEFPFDGDKADIEAKVRTALGYTFVQGDFGRAWSPMVEIMGTAEFADPDTEFAWDIVPQMQVTLNTRQHVMLNAGVRIPITDTSGRSTQILVYLLWDWFDGGLFDGW